MILELYIIFCNLLLLCYLLLYSFCGFELLAVIQGRNYMAKWHNARSPSLGWNTFFGLHVHLAGKCSTFLRKTFFFVGLRLAKKCNKIARSLAQCKSGPAVTGMLSNNAEFCMRKPINTSSLVQMLKVL